MDFKHGIYRHFKGHTYRTLLIVRDSETLEEMVVYSNVESENDLWVRPVKMFTEIIEREGKQMSRFEYVEEDL